MTLVQQQPHEQHPTAFTCPVVLDSMKDATLARDAASAASECCGLCMHSLAASAQARGSP